MVAEATTTTSRSDRCGPWPGRAAVARAGRWGPLLFSIAALTAPACRCNEAAPTPAIGSAAPAEVIPAPAGLLAEIFVPRPEAVWGRAQPVLERVIGLHPVGFSAVVVEALGIPASYAPGVTLERPVTGVVVDAAPPRLVLALPLRSGRELVAALTTGQSPTHRAAETLEPTVVVLEREGGGAGEPTIGVTGNSLLVGARAEDLARFGPYAARTLGRRAMPSGPIEIVVPRGVLEPVLARRVGERWAGERERLQQLERQSRTAHGGRAADFAEPAAVIEILDGLVESARGCIASADELRLTIDLGPERLEFGGELVPAARGAARDLVGAMPVGEARSLLSLPAGVEMAVTWRSTADGRERQAASLVASLARLFGSRLTAGDRVLLERAATGLARATGDRLAIGVLSDDAGRALLVQTDAADATAFDAALRAVLRTMEVDALVEPLSTFLGAPAAAIDRAPVPGAAVPATRARIVFVPQPSTVAPAPRTELWWFAADGRGHAALGASGGAVLARSLAADGAAAASLAADPRAVAAVERAGREVTVAALLAPRRLGVEAVEGAAPPGPLLLSVGRGEGRLRLRGEMDAVVFAELARRARALGSAR